MDFSFSADQLALRAAIEKVCARFDADYWLAPALDHIRHANEQSFVTLQIEDAEAVECVDEIAAVDGVDVLFIGPGDLSISYGVPMETGIASSILSPSIT